MAGYVLKMNILVPNNNQCGQTNLSSEIRHKAYASRYMQASETQIIRQA